MVDLDVGTAQPQLLPEGWQVARLADVLEEVDHRVAALPSLDGNAPLVLSLTKNYGLIPQTERFGKRIAREDLSDYKTIHRGQIVYNPYVIWEGAVHILDRYELGLVSPVYPVWQVRLDKADPWFVDHLLRMPAAVAAYNQYAAGAVNRRRSIKKADFLQIEIPLPPLPEQRAIAHVLRTIQRAREATKKIVAATREFKKSLMRHLFTYGPVPVNQVERVRLKKTEIGPVPEYWRVVQLEDYTDLVQYGTSDRSNSPVGLPVLGIQSITKAPDGELNLEGAGMLDLAPERAARLRLETGDILFVRTNATRSNVGRTSVYRGDPPNALFASYLIRARVNGEFLPEFIRLYTHSQAGIGALSGRASGAADGKFNINSQTIKMMPTPKPSQAEQHAIIGALLQCEKRLLSEETRRNALESLFSSLLQHLMTGKIRFQEPDTPESREVE